MQIKTSKGFLLTGLMALNLSGCSVVNKVFPDHSQDYKKAKTVERLEVPPEMATGTLSDGLVTSDSATQLSDYNARKNPKESSAADILPVQEGIQLERDRDRYWLVVQGAPGVIWPRAREFWLEHGFFITREDAATAILETGWVENRSTIPKGPVRKLIGRVFDQAYSSSYQDKYRMRLEQGQEAGTTEIYVTHQGIVEELQGDSESIQTTKWVPRPSEPDLEVSQLKQMMIFLGADAETADQLGAAKQPAPERANLIKDSAEQATLIVHEDFSRAWRSVGIALDRVGFAVEDRNRSAGVYYVRYHDLVKQENKKGLLSKLAFWSDDDPESANTYQIKLMDDGPETRTVVLDSEGNPETSSTGVRILTLLYEKLR